MTTSTPILDREEYVEQAYFFRSLAERLPQNQAVQDLLVLVREEVLSTTKVPMAIDYLLAELKHSGVFGPAMRRMSHYFAAFQTFLIEESENERGRFDLRTALEALRREAEYRAAGAVPQGMFLYQFECLCRNRLPYDKGLDAMAADPVYNDDWRAWIASVRRRIGMVELADLIYVCSEYYPKVQERRASTEEPPPTLLFGEREGRIALANRQKEPLVLFRALHRQLGYPAVPVPKPVDNTSDLWGSIARRVERMEHRLKLIEEEQRGGIDLTKFYPPPPDAD